MSSHGVFLLWSDFLLVLVLGFCHIKATYLSLLLWSLSLRLTFCYTPINQNSKMKFDSHVTEGQHTQHHICCVYGCVAADLAECP